MDPLLASIIDIDTTYNEKIFHMQKCTQMDQSWTQSMFHMKIPKKKCSLPWFPQNNTAKLWKTESISPHYIPPISNKYIFQNELFHIKTKRDWKTHCSGDIEKGKVKNHLWRGELYGTPWVCKTKPPTFVCWNNFVSWTV